MRAGVRDRMEPSVFLAAVRGRRICVRLPRLQKPVEVSIETAIAIWDACHGQVKVLQRGSLSLVMAYPPDGKHTTGKYRGPDPVDPKVAWAPPARKGAST